MEEEIMKTGLVFFLNYMHENLNLFYDSIQNNDAIIFKYEDYKKDSIQYMQQIFKEIGLCCDKFFVQSVVCEAEEMIKDDSLHKNLYQYEFKQEEDPNRLLTKDHNTSNGKTKKYRDFFSNFQNDIILKDKRIRRFLEKYGFTVVEIP